MLSRKDTVGTFAPISISPSLTGSVSSNTLAFVKLRMLKLSIHFSGQACRSLFCSYSTRILRTNICRFYSQRACIRQLFRQRLFLPSRDLPTCSHILTTETQSHRETDDIISESLCVSVALSKITLRCIGAPVVGPQAVSLCLHSHPDRERTRSCRTL